MFRKKKQKGKVRRIKGHEGHEGEYRYSSTLSLTSALDGGKWLTPRSGRFTPGQQPRYSMHRRLGGPQDPSGQAWKISTSAGYDPRTVQPAISETPTELSRPTIFRALSILFIQVQMNELNKHTLCCVMVTHCPTCFDLNKSSSGRIKHKG